MRGIVLDPADILADVRGVNRTVDGLPLLREVHVHYRLRIPAGARGTVDRALERHASKCPTAQSLKGAIEVVWTAEIEERDPSS